MYSGVSYHARKGVVQIYVCSGVLRLVFDTAAVRKKRSVRESPEDSELGEDFGAGGGGAVAIESDDVAVLADVLPPSQRRACFDGEFGHVGGEHAGLVSGRLLVEDFRKCG